MIISLKTEFEPPANAYTHERQLRNDMTVTAASTCMGKAIKLCGEIAEAIELGLPAAQVVMIDRINTANRTGVPTYCALECSR